MMHIPYQKIFIGIITLLSSVFLVLSIKDNVTTAIIFHSVVILCAGIYYAVEYFYPKKQSQKQMIPIQSVMKQFFTYITSIKSYLSYIFLFLLILITIGSLQFDFIQNIPLLDSIVSFLSKHSILLTIFAIISGGLTFWIHKEEIETSEEQELMREEQAEKIRSQEFATKYPRINSIPVIRNIIRWMYVEGWLYGIGLILIVILGFVLRIFNLGKLGFWIDETHSALAAKNFIETGIPYLGDGLIYLRAPLYTLLNSLTTFLFGFSEFSIRLTPLFFSLATIIVIYFILKKITNKHIALLGSLIFSLSDYSLLYARYNRFYIALSFFIILLIFNFYKGFIEGRKINKIYSIILAVIICGFDSKAIIFLPILTLFLVGYDYQNFKKESASFRMYLKQKSKLLNKEYILFFIFSVISFLFFNKIDKINTLTGEQIRTFREQSFIIDAPLPGFIKELIYPAWNNYFFNFLHDFYPLILIGLFCLCCLFIFKKGERILNLRDLFSFYLISNIIFLSIYTVNVLHFDWDQRHFSFLFGLTIIIFCIFLFYLSKIIRIKKCKIFMILIIFSLGISQVGNINPVINMGYGDDLRNTNLLVMKAEPYRSDYKTPFLFINENYERGDKVLVSNFGGNRFLDIYLNKYVERHYFDNGGDSLVSLVEENSDRNIWVVDILYDMNKHHAKYRWGESYRFMESNKDKIVYYGLDNKTRVFLFE